MIIRWLVDKIWQTIEVPNTIGKVPSSVYSNTIEVPKRLLVPIVSQQVGKPQEVLRITQ